MRPSQSACHGSRRAEASPRGCQSIDTSRRSNRICAHTPWNLVAHAVRAWLVFLQGVNKSSLTSCFLSTKVKVANIGREPRMLWPILLGVEIISGCQVQIWPHFGEGDTLACDLRWEMVLSALCTVECKRNRKHVQSLRKRVERLLLMNKRGWWFSTSCNNSTQAFLFKGQWRLYMPADLTQWLHFLFLFVHRRNNGNLSELH